MTERGFNSPGQERYHFVDGTPVLPRHPEAHIHTMGCDPWARNWPMISLYTAQVVEINAPLSGWEKLSPWLTWFERHGIDPQLAPVGQVVVRNEALRGIFWDRYAEPLRPSEHDSSSLKRDRVFTQLESPPLPWPAPPEGGWESDVDLGVCQPRVWNGGLPEGIARELRRRNEL